MNAPMILLLAATQIAGLPLDVLPKQDLPATGCAAYLWTATEQRSLVAVASAEPGRLRLSLDGAIIDLPRTAQRGAANFGLSETTEYAAAGIHATLDLTIETRGDLVKGAAVPDGALRLDRDGKDGVVVPVTGLVGCSG
ncbi:hypothetical protein PX554_14080 [Sphingomonas sp. H39-1-10]|uniref:hypothetical protein n=1 Tax=Sphingomonas pollutisoli TaxID=3030829 RepID=UPI0023B8B3AA|nr:hypothetical protein [Sphingomonas pollutisoli]MDF0489264.1 hypothetical protein [Sphingomonas pollutisoli]